MKVVNHPYLEGVKLREDGAVFIPQSGTNKGPAGHWTFGSMTKGYRQVHVGGKFRRVHRLICEAFHGLCPEGKGEVDHINRTKSDNRPENLRWCSRSENCRNKKVCEVSAAKYGVSYIDNSKAYRRSYYANNPEYRERVLAYQRTRYAKKKAETTQK